MEKIKSFADRRPLAFAFVVTLVFILMVIISSVAANAAWPGETPGWFLGSTIGRLVSILILLIMVSRLGWLGPAGFTRPGRWGAWLLLLLPLAYAIPVSAYTMTGNIDFGSSDLALTGLAALFLTAHAFMEEVTFRGLILNGFVRRWGGTYRGLIQSILVSSLFFGGMHIIYLAGERLPVVLLRIVVGFLLGILFGALVLREKSIYPATFFHAALNLAGYLNLANQALAPGPFSWLLLSLLMVPLAVFGIYMLRSNSSVPAIPEAAKGGA